MIADRLRTAILQAAISGKLTDQRPEDGTATELLEQIAVERAALIKAKKLKKQKPLPPVTEDEQPLCLPSNWMWSRLGDVAISNPTVTGTDAEQIGFLPMASIEDGYTGRIHPQGRKWSEVKSGFTKFAEGDVVLAKITPCFQNRKSAIVRRLGSQYGAGTTELHVLRPASTIEAAYLLFFLKSEYVQDELTPQMTGTAGQKRVPLGALTSLPIPVPPFAEQQRIVAKLDEVLPLIDQLAALEREREHLDREFAKAIERAILQAAISGKLTKQLPEDGTATELLDTIKAECQQLEKEGKIKKRKPLPSVDKAEEPFELPETWAWACLGQVAECGGGATPKGAVESDTYNEGDVPFFRVSAMNIAGNEQALVTPSSWISGSTKSRTPYPSVVFPKNGGAVFTNKRRKLLEEGLVDLNTGYVFPIRLGLDYVYYWFNTVDLATVSTGSALPTVNAGIISKLPIPLPPEPEQDRIVVKLNETLPVAQGLKELMA
jgi:type I restriction enzyme S subunit